MDSSWCPTGGLIRYAVARRYGHRLVVQLVGDRTQLFPANSSRSNRTLPDVLHTGCTDCSASSAKGFQKGVD